MSVIGDIEADLAGKLETAITGAGNVVSGPVSQPRAEGKPRSASVRVTVGNAQRLDFGQNNWSEAYAVTVWWHAATVSRATRHTEWEAFAAAPFRQRADEGADALALSTRRKVEPEGMTTLEPALAGSATSRTSAAGEVGDEEEEEASCSAEVMKL